MKTFEDVNGIIVGGFSCKVCLIDPEGSIVDYKIVPDSADFKSIADDMKFKILSEKLGNGQLLRDRPDLIRSLHGVGKWELKIISLK